VVLGKPIARVSPSFRMPCEVEDRESHKILDAVE
jgi:hypothetical protein